jgi:hypothetical protein
MRRADVSTARASRRRADAVEDASGKTVDTIMWSKGVKRDVKAQYKSALEFNDAYAIPIDGDVKAKGKKFFASRRVPPGTACRSARMRGSGSSGSRTWMRATGR